MRTGDTSYSNAQNMSNSTCPILDTDYKIHVIESIGYIAYFWVWPICLAFDFAGHTICFIAFYKESKNNGVYSFQFYDAVAKAADTCSAFLLLATLFWFCGLSYPGAQWFESNYALMWYAAHLAIPLNDMTTTIALLISLFMTLDRAISIGLPFKYKNLNRKLWEGLSVSVSVLLGVSCSLFVCPYFSVEKPANNTLYSLTFRGDYVSGPVATGFAHLRNVLWILGLISLVGTGFSVVFLYHRNTMKVADMTSVDNRSSQKKRKIENVLFMLTVYYSFQIINEMTILMTHTFLGQLDGFQTCAGRLFTPLRAMEIAFVNGSDFYVMLILSKSFREMIKRSLTGKTSPVTAVSMSKNGRQSTRGN